MDRNLKERIKKIEDKFFDLNDETKEATVKLEFEKSSDLFNTNAITKVPMLTSVISEWVSYALETIPKKYKVNFEITINDFESYTKEQMSEIFLDNSLLEIKRGYRAAILQNKLAIGLLGVGILFILAFLLVQYLWSEKGTVSKEITIFILEIGAWVTIWEALDVFIIQNSSKRRQKKNLSKRLKGVKFIQKQ